MRALVVGSDGGIGGPLVAALSAAGWEVYGSSRRPCAERALDLAALPDRLDFPSVDSVFLCAAMTRQAECESDPERSWQVNATAPIRIARAIAATGAQIVFLSSTAVFDGTVARCPADHRPCPVTEYGRQKAAAEREILSLPGAVVLRLNKVLTPRLPLFRSWIGALRASRPVEAFHDLCIAPVALDDVTAALELIARTRAEGVFQASASADVSYADLCRHIARRLGVEENLVSGVSAAAAGPMVAGRPASTSLDATRLSHLTGVRVPDAYEVVDRVFGLGPIGD